MFEEKLIEEVKKHEILYKKSSGGYKNVAAKCKIWNDIATKLSSTDDVCQKTWKSLRDRFCREYKKMTFPSGSAAPASDLWEYWDLLIFLKDHIKPRSTTSNFKPITRAEDLLDDSYLVDDSEPNSHEESHGMQAENIVEDGRFSSTSTSSCTPTKGTKVNEFESKFTNTLDTFNTYLKNKNKNKNDGTPETTQSPSNVFAISVSNILDTLSPTSQMVARARILQVLTDVQLAELNIETDQS